MWTCSGTPLLKGWPELERSSRVTQMAISICNRTVRWLRSGGGILERQSLVLGMSQQEEACKIEYCKTPKRAMGMCMKHYMRVRKHGKDIVAYRTTHRMSSTPEYYAWESMLGRCYNPQHPSYESYGGRGISVCQRWNSFENFYADMGKRPQTDMSIDRINNDQGYGPSNCRWATSSQQVSNRRPRELWPSYLRKKQSEIARNGDGQRS